MNKKYGIKPKSIVKPIREKLIKKEEIESSTGLLPTVDLEALTPMDRKKLISQLKREMRLAANDLNFELAIEIRDRLKDLLSS
jgi:excinuclease ABC subunit B